jgi:hypothetical protein
MANIEQILNTLREALTEELRAEVRAEIIAELGGGQKKVTAPKKPGPKKEPALPDNIQRFGERNAKRVLTVKAGQRRTEEDIAQAAKVVSIWFQKNPGSRVDQASAALGVPVKDLQRPIQFLLENKKLAKKGKLRGTTYQVRG